MFGAQHFEHRVLLHFNVRGGRGKPGSETNNHLKSIVLSMEMSQIYTRLLSYFGLLWLLSEQQKKLLVESQEALIQRSALCTCLNPS